MTGSAASGPISPQPQYGRAVSHNCNRVFLDGEIAGSVYILLNGQAYPGNARGIGHGQIIAVCEWNFVDYLDFPSSMHVKSAVDHLQGSEFLEGSDGFDYHPFIVFVPCLDKNFPDDSAIVRMMKYLHFQDLTARTANCDHEV